MCITYLNSYNDDNRLGKSAIPYLILRFYQTALVLPIMHIMYQVYLQLS